MQLVRSLASLSSKDVAAFGGKNASLGELIQHLSPLGVPVPPGFATDVAMFNLFLNQDGLADHIYQQLDAIDVSDIAALRRAGQQIRSSIIDLPFQAEMIEAVTEAYLEMGDNVAVAVRSSATAEDLPQASFAGQQETFLNVIGIEGVLAAIKQVFASLFNDRAIAYRVHQGFDHREVLISVGVQRMVRSDKAVSGVMFTLDTESGYEQVVLINAAYGLGELVVQGAINPDEYYVFKPTLKQGKEALVRRHLGTKHQAMVYSTDAQGSAGVTTTAVAEVKQQQFALQPEEALALARYAVLIEEHYQCPMDIEWAKDGITNEFFIVQARPETVNSQAKCQNVVSRYHLSERKTPLVVGRSVGQKIGQGKVCLLASLEDAVNFASGAVLVTDMTDPDWEPLMKQASAIVTNQGGRTCHAAIIARELGIPAVVGTGNATMLLTESQEVTVSCAEGDIGYVYPDLLAFDHQQLDVNELPDLPVSIMLNVGNPDRAFAFHAVPNQGVGLARLEFLISNHIGIHPNALLALDAIEDESLKRQITRKIAAYQSPKDYYIERLKEGIATIACAFYPKPVIVRLSDFKSNEYANLLGGKLFEPDEENPMLGFRGASRYVSEAFGPCFAMECEAVKLVREQMGLTNVQVMVPFVRTVDEASDVVDVLASEGLKRGENGLKIIMMCELPSNALLADAFLNYFDGFSIGSNDLTQMTLGLDRDSALVADRFDERDQAVKALLRMAITTCKAQGKYVGICGQGPSDHKDFAAWLVEQGISSLSLNPDTVIDTMMFMSAQLQETS